MKIYLLGSMDAASLQDWQKHLQAEMPEEQVLTTLAPEQNAEIDVAVVANPTPGALRELPSLRLIQSLWAGVDRLVADESLPIGVPVCRMVDPHMNVAMAETGQWAVLALHRGFFRYARQQAQACWQPLTQRRADEVRVLVLGWGEMGRTLGMRLKGMGYRVAAWRMGTRRDTASGAHGVTLHEGPLALRCALAEADVLINLLPLTPITRGCSMPSVLMLCRAAQRWSIWRAGPIWWRLIFWRRWTQAISLMLCSMSSPPSPCRLTTRFGGVPTSRCCRTPLPKPTRAVQRLWWPPMCGLSERASRCSMWWMWPGAIEEHETRRLSA
ncbi:NAD(P)-dependent oxidoreductase [Ideonella paludis]